MADRVTVDLQAVAAISLLGWVMLAYPAGCQHRQAPTETAPIIPKTIPAAPPAEIERKWTRPAYVAPNYRRAPWPPEPGEGCAPPTSGAEWPCD